MIAVGNDDGSWGRVSREGWAAVDVGTIVVILTAMLVASFLGRAFSLPRLIFDLSCLGGGYSVSDLLRCSLQDLRRKTGASGHFVRCPCRRERVHG